MTDTGIITDPGHDAAEKHHPSDLDYVKIAVGLAVITGAEVVWSYRDFHGALLVLPLLVMMAVKFAIVASRFMHLHFDNKILTRLFYTGLILASVVYLVALSDLSIWHQH